MRYVNAIPWLAASAMLVSGCGNLTSLSQSPAPAESAPAAANAAPIVDPAIQKAYDAALQALKDGHTEQARRGFLALAKSNADLGGPHANLGLILRRSGNLAAAASEFEQATHINPMQPQYFNQLGITYRQMGQFQKAREAYEQAIKLDPDYAEAQLNLGILLDLYLWNGEQALLHYERYLALSPGGDDVVGKWIIDLKNRVGRKKPVSVSRMEEQ